MRGLQIGSILVGLFFPWLVFAQPRLQVLGPPLPKKVERVVTLAPSLTDMVLALKSQETLVGVSRFDERSEVASLPRVGGFLDPSVEAVLALKPHVVLVQPSPGNQKPVELMAKLGLTVMVLPLDSVASVSQAMREVGQVLGKEKAGRALAEELDATRRRLRQQSARLPRLRVMMAYDFQPLVVAGPGSFAHELLADVGAENVCAVSTAYAVFSVEQAVKLRPDVVIDATHASLGVEKLRNLKGLKEARWVRLKTQHLMHPGPQLVQGAEELFELLHSQGRPP